MEITERSFRGKRKRIQMTAAVWVTTAASYFLIAGITTNPSVVVGFSQQNTVASLSNGAVSITLRYIRDIQEDGGSRQKRRSSRQRTERFSTATQPESIRRSPLSTNDPIDSSIRFNQGRDNNNNNFLVRDEGRSSFWSTTMKQNEYDDIASSSVLPLPNVPTLDYDGPLPREAYRTLGDPRYEPKPTCLLTIAVDVKSRNDDKGNRLYDNEVMNPHIMVKRLQRLIDSGFTTFSLKLPNDSVGQEWAEENVYGRLLRDTPASALAQTQLIVPMTLPYHGESTFATTRTMDGDEPPIRVTANTIRQMFLGSLQRIGADCIDTLQLQYVKGSPYHLDVMDYLTDLQRDGLIRSIAGRNLPAEFLERANRCGFHVDNNQIDGGSLLLPMELNDDTDDNNPYNSNSDNIKGSPFRQRPNNRPSLQSVMSKIGTRLVLASPLAGGLLTERHYGKPWELQPWQFVSDSEREQYFSTRIPRWFRQRAAATPLPTGNGKNNKNYSRWLCYQRQLLEPLHEIALKHGVSIASVSLRFVLQSQQGRKLQQKQQGYHEFCDPFLLESVVIANHLGGARIGDNEDVWDRPQQLRQVFRFALDEEDMERLHGLSYQTESTTTTTTTSGVNNNRQNFRSMATSWEEEENEKWDLEQNEEQQLLLNNLSNRRLWL